MPDKLPAHPASPTTYPTAPEPVLASQTGHASPPDVNTSNGKKKKGRTRNDPVESLETGEGSGPNKKSRKGKVGAGASEADAEPTKPKKAAKVKEDIFLLFSKVEPRLTIEIDPLPVSKEVYNAKFSGYPPEVPRQYALLSRDAALFGGPLRCHAA